MESQFKLGQVVRFKNYRRTKEEKEAYFVVIQEEDTTHEMKLYTLNSNRYYTTGSTIIPEFAEEDLRIVDVRTSCLINEQITIKETLFNDVVTGTAVYFPGDNDVILFKQIGTALVSDAVFEFEVSGKNRLMGPLFIEMEYENNNQY